MLNERGFIKRGQLVVTLLLCVAACVVAGRLGLKVESDWSGAWQTLDWEGTRGK